MARADTVLFAVGYPAAMVVITRFVPVVRERRLRWLAVHHAGVAAIIAGYAIKGVPTAMALNGAWLAASTAWYAAGGRRSPEARPAGAARRA